MSYIRVMLGPLPCIACGTIVRWVRMFDGLVLFETYHDRLGRTYQRPHECPALQPHNEMMGL